MRTLLSLAFCGLAATALHAEGLSDISCPTATLSDYISNFQSPTVGAANGPCSAGILNFSEFGFLSFGGTATDPLLGSNGFTLTPLLPTDGDGTGFTISPTNASSFNITTGSATYVIDWFFAIDAGPIANGADLGMDPKGDVTITAQYCLDSFMTAFSLSGTSTCTNGPDGSTPALQMLSVTAKDNQCPVTCSASITFPTPAFQFADVRTIISLNSDQGPVVFDSTSSRSDIIPGTPEPGTWVLGAGGILLVCFLRIRVQKIKGSSTSGANAH